MRIIEDPFSCRLQKESVITLGKFDGVHRGHQALLHEVERIRRNRPLQSVVFTFDVSPQIRLGQAPRRTLMTNAERRRLFEGFGIDILVECPFTGKLRNMPAEEFVRGILEQRLGMKAAVVGDDFHFGKNRGGNPAFLRAVGETDGFQVSVIPRVRDAESGIEISSSYCRDEVEKGHIRKANSLLGYSYFISGPVRHGKQLGRTIGIPTINLIPPEEKLLPPNGVYESEVRIGAECFAGVTNIGKRPTVHGTGITVETHLLDAAGDFYGMDAVVALKRFIRPERKFESVSALRDQMEKDIQTVRS